MRRWDRVSPEVAELLDQTESHWSHLVPLGMKQSGLKSTEKRYRKMKLELVEADYEKEKELVYGFWYVITLQDI